MTDRNDKLCCTMKLIKRSSALVAFSISVWSFSAKLAAELADENITVIVLELFTALAIFLCTGWS